MNSPQPHGSPVPDDPLDRLDRAIAAFMEHRQDPAADGDELLRRHPDLRDLLEPMLQDTIIREAPADVTERLGAYRIEREIGRGGMGVVYEATDETLGRRVALKVLPVHGALAPTQIERFRREAAAIARLQHPGIVPVYAVGESEGIHYFAMELVAGASLATLIQRRAASGGSRLGVLPANSRAAEAAELVAQIADALHYAHEHGVIHRDVKPHNVLIGEDGRARLVDFGLARDDTRDGLTATGCFAGTPEYTSPEQAKGQGVDRRTDVFALGVVLYELLTGVRPFQGNSAAAVLAAISHLDPVPLRRHDPRIPRDLATICERALERDQHRRYPTAEALADDLRRFLRYEPIEARAPSTLTRLWRRARRRPAVSAGLAAALLVGLGWGVHANQQAAVRRELLANTQLALEQLFVGAGRHVSPVELSGIESYRERLDHILDLVRTAIDNTEGEWPEWLQTGAAQVMDRASRFYGQIGLWERAGELLDRGIELRQALVRRFPQEPWHRFILGLHYDSRFWQKAARGVMDRADRETADRLWSEVLAGGADPDTLANTRAEWARSAARLAACYRRAGRPAESTREATRARELLRECGEPAIGQAVNSWCSAHVSLAVCAADEPHEARRLFRTVIERIGREKDPSVVMLGNLRQTEVRALTQLAELEAGEGDLDAGSAAYTKAIAIGTPLARGYGGVAMHRLLTSAHFGLARIAIRKGEYAAAAKHLASCAEHSAGLPPRVSSEDDLHRVRIDGCRALVLWLEGTPPEEADRRFAAVDAEVERLLAATPDDLELLSAQGSLRSNWASMLYQRSTLPDRVARAERLLRDAIRVQTRSVQGRPEHRVYREFLRLHYELLVSILFKEKRADDIVAASKAFLATEPSRAPDLVHAAWLRAISILRLRKDPDAVDVVEEAAADAIRCLTAAAKLGYPVTRFPRYDDFKPLFARPGFAPFLKEKR